MEQAARGRAQTAVELLERVLSGEIGPAIALQEWPEIDAETDDLLAASWHDLSHFSADEDIRRKDRGYAEYQAQLLARRVQEIRTKFELG